MADKIIEKKRELFSSQKHVFWQAFILAAFIFAVGILLGFMLENSRTAQIENIYIQTELNLLDVKVQSDIFSSLDSFDCASAVSENLKLADQIYSQSKELDKYETENKISSGLVLEHKKYDLMRAMLWANAIKIKKQCNASYHTLVYIYDYNNPRLDTRAMQSVFSKLLTEVKSAYGDRVLLIPLAGDNALYSVSILMNSFNISESDLPVVLIDEKYKITNIQSKTEIDSLLS